MSWTVTVQRSSESSSYTKYEVSAFREGEDKEWSSVFELDRKAIVGEFQRLLPNISGEVPRFRSLQKFADLAEDPLQSIYSIGSRIYSVLDSGLKNVINSAESIHIKTNDLDVPWEVMCEDEEPICLKYSCGISPLESKKDKLPLNLEKRKGKLNVFFIVDTKGNLPQTREETHSITDLLSTKNIKVAYDIREGNRATYSSVRNYIKDHKLDIVHVAAHAEFNESNPGNSGIVVYDGLLRPKDIYEDVKEDPPWLVFMNACESARIVDSRYLEKYRELSDLATVFLRAGASSYVGTICRISDKAASQFAISFYDKLLTASSVGQSMQNARKEFFEQHKDEYEDLSWLAFRLYGDPNSKRDFIAEALMDMEEKVKEYIEEKKQRRHSFKITDLARDLNISVSEARHILSRVI